jgi:hypothetical protein
MMTFRFEPKSVFPVAEHGTCFANPACAFDVSIEILSEFRYVVL